MRNLTLYGFLLLLLVSLFGCRDADLEALESYHQSIQQSVNPLMRDFAKKFAGIQSKTKLGPLRAYVTTTVVPALNKYIQALNNTPCKTKRLSSIHSGLEGSYKKMGALLKRFGQEADTETKRLRLVVALRKQAKKLEKALRTYRNALKAYSTQVQNKK